MKGEATRSGAMVRTVGQHLVGAKINVARVEDTIVIGVAGPLAEKTGSRSPCRGSGISSLTGRLGDNSLYL